MITRVRSIALVVVSFAFLLPFFVSAKSPENFHKSRSYSVTADYLTVSSTTKLAVQAEIYPNITFLRVDPARPFYVFPRAKNIQLTFSGLDPAITYYLYKEKLRNPIVFTPDSEGAYTFALDTPRHRYLILKTSPSTYHIDATSSGNDCSTIGTWNFSTLTCTLDPAKTINEIIEIDDGNITLDGNGRTITNTEGIGVYANRDPFFDDDMMNITIKNLTIQGTTVGIHLVDVSNHHINNVTLKNTTTAIDLKDDSNITITQDNLIDNTTDLFTSNTSWVNLSTTNNRGNFWQKHACTQDPSFPDHCTNSYDTGPATDALPWACQNAWKTGISCPFTPPTTRTPTPTTTAISGTWAKISSNTGTAKLYIDQTPNDTRVHKILPNDWVLKVLDDTGTTWKVEDVTDATVGWIVESQIQNTNDSDKASIIYDTKSKRTPLIISATDTYQYGSDISNSLYGTGGGLDNKNNFGAYITGVEFPKELHLAITAQESAGSGFNNNKCSFASDGGIGISQITTPSYKGLGSGLRNFIRLNDCVGSNDEGLYYGNTFQGIYANIKDGFRVFQEKFNQTSALKKITDSPISTWWSTDTYSVNKRDLKLLVLVRSYNGYGQRCQPFLTDPRYSQYQALISDRLKNLSSYFPGINYSNSDYLVQKLYDSSNNHIDVSICSPAVLLVSNDSGLSTGFTDKMIDQIPEVDFDYEDHKAATILFPQGSYTYTVTGTEDGTYIFYADRFINGASKLYQAINIPTSKDQTHTYNIDWNKNKATILIDYEGDGKIDVEAKSDLMLTSDEFANFVKKITICHIPSGDISKSNTITIARPALKAHLDHGDTEGPCTNLQKSNKKK